jgi:hypothetical protein
VRLSETEIHRRTPESMMRYFADQALEIANRSGDVELGGLGIAMRMAVESLDAEPVDDRIGHPLDPEFRRKLFAKLKAEDALVKSIPSVTPGQTMDVVFEVVEREDDYRIFLVGVFPPDTPEPARRREESVQGRIQIFYGARMDQQILGLGKEGMQ